MPLRKTHPSKKSALGFDNINIKDTTNIRTSGRKKHRSPETIYKSAKILIAVLIIVAILLYVLYTIIIDYSKS